MHSVYAVERTFWSVINGTVFLKPKMVLHTMKRYLNSVATVSTHRRSFRKRQAAST